MASKTVYKKQCPECGPGRLVFQEFRMVDNAPKKHHKCDSCAVEVDLDEIYPREEIVYDTEDEVVD